MQEPKNVKFGIIGAGAAGLAAAKYCLEYEFDFVVYEQSGHIGGTWVYTEQVGVNEFGLPIHSSMYKDLRTNLPKEVMAFEDFPFPNNIKESYITHEQVLEYIKSYANHFNINPHIKFYHHTTKIQPKNNSSFEIITKNLKTNQDEIINCQYVIVCNGHYTETFIPNIPGLENFEGVIMHSHDFRQPKVFTNKSVVVVGAGPSGQDISKLLVSVAKQVILSENHQNNKNGSVIKKPRIEKIISKHTVLFSDGSSSEVDSILFCSGYKYQFPFITPECEINVEKNYVSPLYKQIININYPNMAFIGIPVMVPPFPLFCLQIRFFFATVTGHYAVPSKMEMLTDITKWEKLKRTKKLPLHRYHRIENLADYQNDLATTADINNLPPVLYKLYSRVRKSRNREDIFKLIDNENFEQVSGIFVD